METEISAKTIVNNAPEKGCFLGREGRKNDIRPYPKTHQARDKNSSAISSSLGRKTSQN